MAWRRAKAAEDLWSGEMAGVQIGTVRVLLASVDGRILAYEDACVHQRVPLSEGRLDSGRLVCRAHGWEYDLATGRGINPAAVCLRRFAVKAQNGEIYVDVDRPVGEAPISRERIEDDADDVLR